MKAIVQDRYGLADVLELRDVEKPQPGDDELLIRVQAAGVDPGVWHLMTGKPYLVRAMGFGFRKPKFRIRGSDAAGIVKAAGKTSSISRRVIRFTVRAMAPLRSTPAPRRSASRPSPRTSASSRPCRSPA
jgi:NADPH:quinone reductase-like Zn-dependent oxidoreductase